MATQFPGIATRTGCRHELQMRSRGANGRSHTSFLCPVPPSKWDTWFDGSR